MVKKLSKDYFLRKQYKRFETWNKLNKSLKKSQIIYNIPACSVLKRKKNTVKRLFVIIVFKRVEVVV